MTFTFPDWVVALLVCFVGWLLGALLIASPDPDSRYKRRADLAGAFLHAGNTLFWLSILVLWLLWRYLAEDVFY